MYLLVESDTVFLRTIRHIIRSGLLQLCRFWSEHSRQEFHELGRAPLISSLHNTDLSATSAFPVPDVLSQQDRLERRREKQRHKSENCSLSDNSDLKVHVLHKNLHYHCKRTGCYIVHISHSNTCTFSVLNVHLTLILRVQYFAQGNFCMQTGAGGDQTTCFTWWATATPKR